jgi:hypothetical protein
MQLGESHLGLALCLAGILFLGHVGLATAPPGEENCNKIANE